MSVETTVYLRKKNPELLKFRDYDYKENLGERSEATISNAQEREEYNDKVLESLGCQLFYLCTTPSRELEVLPFSDQPSFLTERMLDSVLAYYDQEIEYSKKYIRQNREEIKLLEERIVKVNSELYDKISEEITCSYNSIRESKENLKSCQYFRSKFAFVKEIMKDSDNAQRYELIYTKC